MDLKALLLEAKQKVPPVLQVLHCGDETMLDINGERLWPGTGTSHRAAAGTGLWTGLPVPGQVLHTWAAGGDVGIAPLLLGWGGCSPGVTLLPPDAIPPVTGDRGCAFCGGLGHRITDCPKLEAMQTKQVSNIGRKDYLAHSSMDF